MPEPLPMVDGLTQTADDARPTYQRLTEFLARRPGGSARDLANGMEALERAHQQESDSDVRARIAAALTLLRGDSSSDDPERSARRDGGDLTRR